MAKLPSVQRILDLADKAREGDRSSWDELFDLNRQLAKRANSSLSRLEKVGYSRYAYNRAIDYLKEEFGNNRFTSSKKKLNDLYDLRYHTLQARKFLSSRSSTVKGNRAIDKQIIEKFKSKGVIIPEGKEGLFLDLISSDDFAELKKNYVSSEELVDDMVDMTANYGINIEKITKAFNEVVSTEGTTTYDIALEKIGYVI